MDHEFKPFGKIPRLRRECIITEKIDGTNASVFVSEDGIVRAASRTRWITPDDDNYGFAKWTRDNADDLSKLGPGHHFGEWWGRGIQRNYGMETKAFSLFNTSRWADDAVRPSCCRVVPVLYSGIFDGIKPVEVLDWLAQRGSVAAHGFMKPEGIIVYHIAADIYFKTTIEKDEEPKGKST